MRESFQRAGIVYRESPLDKSAAYLEAEPLFAQGRIEILDHPHLARELKLLERRPRQVGVTALTILMVVTMTTRTRCAWPPRYLSR